MDDFLVRALIELPVLATFIWYTLRRDAREKEHTEKLIDIISALCAKRMQNVDKDGEQG